MQFFSSKTFILCVSCVQLGAVMGKLNERVRARENEIERERERGSGVGGERERIHLNGNDVLVGPAQVPHSKFWGS